MKVEVGITRITKETTKRRIVYVRTESNMNMSM